MILWFYSLTWACRLGNVPFLSSLTRQAVPRGCQSGWVGGGWVWAAVQRRWGGTGGGQPPSDGLGRQARAVGPAAARSRVGRQTLDRAPRAPGSLPPSSLCLAPAAHFFCLIWLPSIFEVLSFGEKKRIKEYQMWHLKTENHLVAANPHN